jgi:hypothetical protein
MDKDKIFVDIRSISFSEWSQFHEKHKKRYSETNDEDRYFRWVICTECNQMYFLGEYGNRHSDTPGAYGNDSEQYMP